MALIVEKFGGSSLANFDRIRHVSDLIIEHNKHGHQLVIVVSAMFGETNRLIEYAETLQPIPHPREYAALLATGEQISMSLLSMALISKGIKAKSYSGAQAKILTDSNFKKARILDINCEDIQKDLMNNHIVVVAGFQGIDRNGNITTLGRGGSDTTAVALASALKASECRIYTDVDGVYTADPKVVPSARKLDTIHPQEMLVLSHSGAKVMQPRSIEISAKYQTPITILSSFTRGTGTKIVHNDNLMEKSVITAIASVRDISKITLKGYFKTNIFPEEVLSLILEADVDVDMVNYFSPDGQNWELSFVVKEEDYHEICNILDSNLTKLGAKNIKTDKNLAKLSVVGLGLRAHYPFNVLKKMLEILNKHNIKVHALATGDIRVSALVDEQFLENGLRALHESLELA